MNHLFFFIFALLVICQNGWTQNLIENGGFEKMVTCPLTLGDFEIENWEKTLPLNTTPDYFSLCADSNQYSHPKNFIINVPPFEGESYVGLVAFNPSTNYREYITTELKNALQKDVTYIFKITLSQPEMAYYYINNIGVIFTSDFDRSKPLPPVLIVKADINIQVDGFLECRNSWTTYTIEYKALGGEKFLHLGCFLTDEKLLYRTYSDRFNFSKKTGYQDAYYLIDDISLIEKTNTSVNDTLIIEALLKTTPKETYVFNDIKFETGSSSSDALNFKQFEKLIQHLKENPSQKIIIEGHTDNVGKVNDNLQLSKDRALFVKSYFESQSIKNIIYTKGFGDSKPLFPNSNEENKAKNRRVVVKLY